MADNNEISEITNPAFGMTPKIVREMVGRIATGRVITNHAVTVDLTRSDYEFYDRLRRGKEKDYEIGGLFAGAICNILASWAMGKGFRVKLKSGSDRTIAAMQDFINANIFTFLKVVEDSLGLADSYLVVNPDGTMTMVSPDQVVPITEPKGSTNVVGWVITSRFDDTEIIDTFTYFERRTTIKYSRNGDHFEFTDTFPNLIGQLPVIHFPNDKGANELFGHSQVEKLVYLFNRYNRAMTKSLDGVEIMGNPVPVIEGADDPEETLKSIATSKSNYIDSEGATKERLTVDLTESPFMVLGIDTSLQFRSPMPGFTSDSGRMLEYLFLLMLQSSGIPEWAWGGAIASSKASVEAQMPAFTLLIDVLRLKFLPQFKQILTVWAAYTHLFTRNVVPKQEDIDLVFPSIVVADRAQRLLELQFERLDGAITRATALEQLSLVDDPELEVEEAQKEADIAAEKSLQNATKLAQATAPKVGVEGNTSNGDNNSNGKSGS